ncbi:MAG: tetratricopeptide repeat protein [Isosphaeraceae bacterium]|nr:tetratricopeptide repeat protein [Isosphaeraceae bacterium]
MGRSITPVADWARGYAAAKPTPVAVEAKGFEYRVGLEGGRVVHTETRRDAQGKAVIERAAEIAFAVGSGTRGTSFVIDEGGYLFESPLTWYGQARRWDLSPGYEVRNQHFERMVQADCLYCHANPVDPFVDSTNRFRDSIAKVAAIGCERCHGPGGLHVQERQVVDGKDLTIVNPRHLDPVRREAVCQQCHLKGDSRILHAGRQANDYRPGLPLHRVWSVFFRPEQLGNQLQVVGHVEQMAMSRCYRASEGRMGCTSCHDPHQVPPPDQAVAYFRERCLECHEVTGCSVSPVARRLESADDDCAACHMPRSTTRDVIHVAGTDHRILRRRGEIPAPTGTADASGMPLVDFHHNLLESEDARREMRRDLGVALGSGAWEFRNMPRGAALARLSLSLIVPALGRRPDDVVAREIKGVSLWLLNRDAEALLEFEAVLQAAPLREGALVSSAALLSQLGRTDEAIARWRRALAVNPWLSSRQLPLARLLGLRGEWKEAAAVCREALRLNPASPEARKLLVECYLEAGDAESARAEFQTLLALDPPDREMLIRWFDGHPAITGSNP